MKITLLVLAIFCFSQAFAQNHFTLGVEFGSKIDNYHYVNNLGQTFRESIGNTAFGVKFGYNHKQHIFETGFYAYKFLNPSMDYDFVTNQPKKSFGVSSSGLSDYWVPIKYAYEFSINKKQNLFIQSGLAFNIFVSEYYPNKPQGSWGQSSFNNSNDPNSINNGEVYYNGRTNFGLEPQILFIYRIAKKYDVFLKTAYQFGFKPRYYDLITHTNSQTNEIITATRTHSNSFILEVGFNYNFISKKNKG